MEKMNHDLYFMLCTKINLRRITDLNANSKPIKLLGKNMRISFLARNRQR